MVSAKRIFCLFLSLYLLWGNFSTLNAETPLRPVAPQVTAGAAIVMDAATGVILFEQHIHQPHYPASLVKMMTALLAVEQFRGRLYEPVHFSRWAVYSVPRYTSHIAMNEDETLTLDDALYGLMLQSANEVANAIAEHISGDVAAFAQLMNRRAAAIGARNTRFENACGLHRPGQVTTAYDMAVITREALRHPDFVRISSTYRHAIPPTQRQPEYRVVFNTHRMIQPGNPHFNSHVLGGKTGFTNQARHTLVTYAQQDGRTLIVVILQGAAGALFAETQALLDYGFAIPYTRHSLRLAQPKTLPVYEIVARGRTQVGEVVLRSAENAYVELPVDFDLETLEYRLIAPARLAAPVYRGDPAGRLVYSVRGTPLAEVNLLAAGEVPLPVPPPVYAEAPEPHYPPAYETPAVYSGRWALPFGWVDDYFWAFLVPLGLFAFGLVFSALLLKLHRRKGQKPIGVGDLYRYRR